MPLTYDEWLARYRNKPIGMDQMIAETGLPQEIIDLYSTRMRGDYAQQNGLMEDKAPGVYNLQNMPAWNWAQQNGYNPQQLFGGNPVADPVPQVQQLPPAVDMRQRTAALGPIPGRGVGVAPASPMRANGYSLTDVLNQNRQRTIPELGRGTPLDRVLQMRRSGY